MLAFSPKLKKLKMDKSSQVYLKGTLDFLWHVLQNSLSFRDFVQLASKIVVVPSHTIGYLARRG